MPAQRLLPGLHRWRLVVDPTALNKAADEVAGLPFAVTDLVVAVKVASRNHKRPAEELDAIREKLRVHRAAD